MDADKRTTFGEASNLALKPSVFKNPIGKVTELMKFVCKNRIVYTFV